MPINICDHSLGRSYSPREPADDDDDERPAYTSFGVAHPGKVLPGNVPNSPFALDQVYSVGEVDGKLNEIKTLIESTKNTLVGTIEGLDSRIRDIEKDLVLINKDISEIKVIIDRVDRERTALAKEYREHMEDYHESRQ